MDLSDKGPNSKASHWIQYTNTTTVVMVPPSLPPARPLQSLNNSKGRVRARIQHGSRLPQPNYLHLFIKIESKRNTNAITINLQILITSSFFFFQKKSLDLSFFLRSVYSFQLHVILINLSIIFLDSFLILA